MTDNRILVCGGRDFDDWDLMCSVLDGISRNNPVDLIIHGGAKGADSMAGRWAEFRGVSQVIFPANWKGEKKSAGPIRNARMISVAEPDGVVAFPGGKGTVNMIKQAVAADIPVYNVFRNQIENGTTEPDNAS